MWQVVLKIRCAAPLQIFPHLLSYSPRAGVARTIALDLRGDRHIEQSL